MNKADRAVGRDTQRIGVALEQAEKINWKCHATLKKFHGTKHEGNLEAKPYEVIEMDDNLLVNAGINLMEQKLIGGAGTVYDNTNAYIAVGTDNTAAVATNTTLNAENDRQGMEATYPTQATQVITFRSVFDTAASDGVWAEWGIFNAAAAGTMLNHKIAAMGTKSGGSWQLTVTITIS